MKERFKRIRKDAGMTQKAFADRLGLSQNFIAQIEIGTKVPSDRTVVDVCRAYSIREEWLRTGEGEMYDLPEDRTAAIVADLLDRNSPTYDLILNILDRYQQLDPKSQEVIDNFISSLLSKS